VQNLQQDEQPLPVKDIAASFQETVARALSRRDRLCLLDYGLYTITVGGGVAANSGLRKHLHSAALAHNLRVLFPPQICTDNAAMIGCAAVDHLNRGHTSTFTLGVQSRLAITDVMQLYQC
jgi:N6-L-threonylcarbamoyladenine synthase